MTVPRLWEKAEALPTSGGDPRFFDNGNVKEHFYRMTKAHPIQYWPRAQLEWMLVNRSASGFYLYSGNIVNGLKFGQNERYHLLIFVLGNGLPIDDFIKWVLGRKLCINHDAFLHLFRVLQKYVDGHADLDNATYPDVVKIQDLQCAKDNGTLSPLGGIVRPFLCTPCSHCVSGCCTAPMPWFLLDEIYGDLYSPIGAPHAPENLYTKPAYKGYESVIGKLTETNRKPTERHYLALYLLYPYVPLSLRPANWMPLGPSGGKHWIHNWSEVDPLAQLQDESES